MNTDRQHDTAPGLNPMLLMLMTVTTGLAVASNYYAQPLLHTIADELSLSYSRAGIIVTAAASELPSALLEQLADGGVLIIPVGETKQTLTVVRRFGDEFEQQRIGDVRFVPLVKGATQ